MSWWEKLRRWSRKAWRVTIAAAATAGGVILLSAGAVSPRAPFLGPDELWEFTSYPACTSGSPDCDPDCVKDGERGYDVIVFWRPSGSDQEWEFWGGECRVPDVSGASIQGWE